MKSLIIFTAAILPLGFASLPAHAAFTSLYIFGDSVSTTTNNVTPYPYSTNYWGHRYTNGRVWVEVLAQRQGISDDSLTNVDWSLSRNNWSYFGDYSSNLVQNVNDFLAPADANTALFVVWVNNADFVGDVNSFGQPGRPDHGTNITLWNNAIRQSLTNHWKAVTNLYYAKGARTFIMPNAADITAIPEYNQSPVAYKTFVRQRIMDFNTAFAVLLNQARASLPGITIYEPDIFTLLDNVLSRPADYGMTNALYYGQSIDALEDPSLNDKSLNGPGENYIFWDFDDPTARFHALIADVVQQLISPVRIDGMTPLGTSNRLDLVNVPVGLNGFVERSSDLLNWTTAHDITSSNTAQPVFVPATPEPFQFYRLRFPFAWSWP